MAYIFELSNKPYMCYIIQLNDLYQQQCHQQEAVIFTSSSCRFLSTLESNRTAKFRVVFSYKNRTNYTYIFLVGLEPHGVL